MRKLVFSIAAASSFVISAPFSLAETHRIGVLAPFTGDFAIFGDDLRKGAEIALEEINQNGKNVELIYEDDKCLPKDGVAAFKKLSEIDKVQAVIGSGCTGVITTIGPMAERSGIPVLALLDTSDQTKKAGATTYVIGFDSGDVAGIVAKEMYARGVRKAGVLCETDAWAETVRGKFKEHFVQLGGAIASEVDINPGEPDSKPALTKLLASNPDGLYLIPAYNGGRILRDIVKMRIILPLFGPDTLGNAAARDIAKDLADGVVYADIVLDETNPNLKALLEKAEKKFGTKVQTPFYAALGYDAVLLATKAVRSGKPALNALKESTCPECATPFRGFDSDRFAKIAPTLLEVRMNEPVKIE